MGQSYMLTISPISFSDSPDTQRLSKRGRQEPGDSHILVVRYGRDESPTPRRPHTSHLATNTGLASSTTASYETSGRNISAGTASGSLSLPRSARNVFAEKRRSQLQGLARDAERRSGQSSRLSASRGANTEEDIDLDDESIELPEKPTRVKNPFRTR
ncbi:hypothetical protein CPB83DRAFT_423095 [Crepidotus variabilis]|uniref:Uncharacterized protein n=1 Tax=Crepidotus variabilis TaxID=179855 RepID=A0A9P6JVN8_9AGAR|nr:hypothetical protein CPB83DRAFT_423095 [Crepidotus variabilis]